MSIRKLLKLKHKLNSLDLMIQQLGVDLHSFILDTRRKDGHLLPSNEQGENHKGTKI